MRGKRNLVSTLFAAIVFLVALTGCDNATQAPAGVATATQGSTIGQTATPEARGGEVSPTAIAISTTIPAATVQARSCAKINLNEATGDALMAAIPTFNSRMVREFAEYKPYVSIQQFRREIGKYVDESQVAEYEKYVFVPVDTNNSDVETIKQLPGVDDAVATELTTGQPYVSNETFLQALATRVSSEQLAEAGCYLAANQ